MRSDEGLTVPAWILATARSELCRFSVHYASVDIRRDRGLPAALRPVCERRGLSIQVKAFICRDF